MRAARLGIGAAILAIAGSTAAQWQQIPQGWQEIQQSGSGGTVTSVALTAPSIFSVSGSPVTTSGTLGLSLSTQTANTIFSGPTSGGAVAPTFRALVVNDLPTVDVAHGGSGLATLTTYAILTGGTTGTGALQQVGVGSAGAVLTSAGAGALPSFTALPGSSGDLLYNNAAALGASVVHQSTNTIEQYNSTNAQTFSIYSTRIDASNYRRLRVATSGSDKLIILEKLGSPGGGQVYLDNSSGGGSWLRANSGNAWGINVSTSDCFEPGADATQDLGRIARRPRDVYVSRHLITSGTTGPTLAGTGFGTSPTLTLDTGSTDFAGIVTVTAGTTPGSSGTLTVTFNTTNGTNTPAVIANLMNGTGTWNARATEFISSAGTGSFVIAWDNNAANLTASSTYKFTYVTVAK